MCCVDLNQLWTLAIMFLIVDSSWPGTELVPDSLLQAYRADSRLKKRILLR